jgi:hypothetical protein
VWEWSRTTPLRSSAAGGTDLLERHAEPGVADPVAHLARQRLGGRQSEVDEDLLFGSPRKRLFEEALVSICFFKNNSETPSMPKSAMDTCGLAHKLKIPFIENQQLTATIST